MKTYLLLLLTILTILPLSAQSYDRELLIKYNITQVIDYTINDTNIVKDTSIRYKTIHYINPRGLEYRTEYYTTGRLTSFEVMEYNTGDQIIHRKTITQDNKDHITSENNITYTRAGTDSLYTTATYQEFGGENPTLITRKTLTITRTKKGVQTTLYYINGKRAEKIVRKGTPTHYTYTQTSGKSHQKTTITSTSTYNEKGQLISVTSYSPQTYGQQNPWNTHIYTYDERGFRITSGWANSNSYIYTEYK